MTPDKEHAPALMQQAAEEAAIGISERAKNLVDTILLEITANGIQNDTHEWCVWMVHRALRAHARSLAKEQAPDAEKARL